MFTQTIRRNFLQYFRERQHSVVPSSSVVPHDDPTLLFTNAGMNQFKDVFLGKSRRDYTKAATSQKCIRVGGKHNDLENVGHTSRHLTFFEMLGNFSFGDYFKAQAIQYAWELATEVFEFDPARIWPTVYKDDDEAFELWTKFVPAERITRFGAAENFWSMGDAGPCGPCSELLYDRGSHFGSGTKPSEDPAGERFFEFWNLVFMQYNRSPSGEETPLPRPSIDTGAGLERIVALKMGVESLFETDVLRSIIAAAESLTGVEYHLHDKRAPAFRVIADHLRCLSFAISDGAQPSNVDRGYVLRKVLRRAVRYGRILGMEKPFLAQLLPQLTATMGGDYPELVKNQDRIAEILTTEEEAFLRTLKRGGNILNQVMDRAASTQKLISGEDAFKLKDTYGLPLDEILLMAKDAGLQVDQKRFQELETEAKERSRSVHKTVHQEATSTLYADFIQENGESAFLGYEQLQADGKVVGIVVNNTFAEELEAGQEGFILLDKTPFYAEMGGQVGDIGLLSTQSQTFDVTNAVSPYKGLIAHQGKLTKGKISLGDTLNAVVNQERRQKIANNHTATHLLHWALHKVLGGHVKQAGSVVDPDRLRFDFSHHKALTQEDIRAIEDLVNEKIRLNQPVKTYEISYDEAQKQEEIKQFFGEKYGNLVRVVDMNFSKELCGGTHVLSSGVIGLFRIAKEGSIAAGVRRIEAVTGQAAEQLQRQEADLLSAVAASLKVLPQQVQERVEKLIEENRLLTLELKEHKQRQVRAMIAPLAEKVETVQGIPFVSASLPISVEDLRTGADLLAEKLPKAVIALASAQPEKCQVFVKVPDEEVKNGISAHEIIKVMMPILEGSGGGKPNSAQGAGKNTAKLPQAFDTLRQYLSAKR